MSDRQNEINFALNMIYNLCEETNICLLPMEKNGVKFVGIHDNTNNKDYALIKEK